MDKVNEHFYDLADMLSIFSSLRQLQVRGKYNAFSFHRGEKAVLVFKFTDNEKALRYLAKSGFTTLSEEEISAAGA